MAATINNLTMCVDCALTGKAHSHPTLRSYCFLPCPCQRQVLYDWMPGIIDWLLMVTPPVSVFKARYHLTGCS